MKRSDSRSYCRAVCAEPERAVIQARTACRSLSARSELMGIAVTSSAARMNHIIRIIKTLRRLEGAHRPVMPAGPVHLLVAADASAIVGGDRLCNEWRSLANGSLKVYSVPGDHYTLLRDGNAATFARVLKHIFNSAQ